MKDECPCCRGGRGRYLGFNVPLNLAEEIESFRVERGLNMTKALRELIERALSSQQEHA